MNYVLDASAVLCYAKREHGFATVAKIMHQAAISSVNWSEVVQKSTWLGLDTAALRYTLEDIGLIVQPFTADDADVAAKLWQATKHLGLSLADRACLALAQKLAVPVLTTDTAWCEISGINVILLR